MRRYIGEGWEIRAGRWQDSRHSVRAWPDVMITDPPYDERTHSTGRRLTGKGYGDTSTHIIAFPPLEPAELTELVSYSAGIVQRWCLAFCSIEMVGDYARAAGELWIRGGVWRRTNQQPQLSGDRPSVFGDCWALWHRRGRKRWNGGGHAAFYACRYEIPTPIRDKLHPTAKPLDLMLRIVEDYTEPGELVWDPYCGSGTTGVACLRLGRRFIGHEMQPSYARIAADRLRAEERCLTLRDARAGQTSILDAIGDA